ncbi:MAG: hypothetical protein ACP5OG_06190 [Candidatus Nanoarchaeia archaeon]
MVDLNETIIQIYNAVSQGVPPNLKIPLLITAYTLMISLYAIFVWVTYRFLAKKSILELNLNQYNQSQRPRLKKFLAVMFFVLEYIIIVPLITIFWFGALSIFLLLLVKESEVNTILLTSAAIVASIRITAYFSESLSKDLAKMFPFTALCFFILDSKYFSIKTILQRFLEIPALMSNILIYVVFIFITETILWMLYKLVGPEE